MIDDEQIREEIEDALDQTDALESVGYRIEVVVQDGRVRLSGAVRTVVHKALAAQVAAKARGVRHVENELETDHDVAIRVADALDAAMGLRQSALSLDCALGEVVVRGAVHDEERRIIDRVVAAVPGVLSVGYNERRGP